jgi:hypothetical protein
VPWPGLAAVTTMTPSTRHGQGAFGPECSVTSTSRGWGFSVSSASLPMRMPSAM